MDIYFIKRNKRGTMYVVYGKQHAVKGGNPFINQVLNK